MSNSKPLRADPVKSAPERRAAGGESARRVLQLLLCFSKERHTLTAKELATMTGIPLPTAFRYLALLRDMGLLVAQDQGAYCLSARIIALGQAAEAAESLIDLADPIMRRLAEESGETVLLVRRVASAAICVHRIESPHRLRISYEAGQPLPLEHGASARLILASLPPAVFAKHIASIARHDPELATSLEHEVDLARERGWATSEEEVDPGICAAAAAIRDGVGRTVAVLSVPVPITRAPKPTRDRLLQQVRAAADDIGRLLGTAGFARDPERD